ncbi:MAG: VWA domain-containing protein [Gammaproteobacteria bacterium]|nr:VWA domain-containing protein [Gammaproteobacteria bacterium]
MISASDDVYTVLAKQHEPTAAQFLAVRQRLTLDAEDQQRFDQMVWALADSGWHGFEAAAGFLALSETMIAQHGLTQWLTRGQAALGLARINFEPAVIYWRLVRIAALQADGDAQLRLLEKLGLRVQARFEFASHLLADVLRVGEVRFAAAEPFEFSAWVSLTEQMVDVGRAELVRFLDRAPSEISDTMLHALQGHCLQSCLDFLASEVALNQRLPIRVLSDWWPICLQLARKQQGLGPVFNAMLKCPLNLLISPALTHLLVRVDEAWLVGLLLDVAERLPLDQPAVCDAWLTHGMVHCQGSLQRSQAYFKLESAESTDQLSALMGLVRLEDQRRILNLYGEALAGRPLTLVTPADIEAPQHEDTGFTGLEIILPKTYARFDTVQANFEFYKVALLHQLGYQTFHTLRHLERIEQTVSNYEDLPRARALFNVLEGARIDWQWPQRLPGTNQQIQRLKQHACRAVMSAIDSASGLSVFQWILLQSLDGAKTLGSDEQDAVFETLVQSIGRLQRKGAVIEDTLSVLAVIYPLVEPLTAADQLALTQIDHRRGLSFLGEALNLPLLDLELDESLALDEDLGGLSMKVSPEDLMLETLNVGDVDADQAMLMTDLDEAPDALGEAEPKLGGKPNGPPAAPPPMAAVRPKSFYYDEWDYHIQDYRRRWCRLMEIHDSDEDSAYYQDSVQHHAALQKQVRRQLSRLKPELLVKVRGVRDGEEMDLEKAIEAVIDRRAGQTPSEHIYVERHRQGRDVAALFLIDLSASTDDRLPDPNAPTPRPEVYHDFDWSDEPLPPPPEGEKIIDLEKHAVIQMTQALEALGDHYAVSGFSGYGRDQVEYTVCKRFTDSLDATVKAKIGGLKACRSTRMGPAIRHAARQLCQTEARIKALIIISDGYPQDHDYGQDRNDRQYGIHDTMKALTEAKQQGVQSFCLTVDPSGHDYLRLMCPDRQYMVIQDVSQLPNELSKVYRSLTG